MRRDFGDVLVQGKVITQEQLNEAREVSSKKSVPVESVLEQQFQVDAFKILQARAFLAQDAGGGPEQDHPGAERLGLIPPHVAQRHKVVPVTKVNQGGQEVLIVALSDPSNVMADRRRGRRLPSQGPAGPRAEMQIEDIIATHYQEAPMPVPGRSSGAKCDGGHGRRQRDGEPGHAWSGATRRPAAFRKTTRKRTPPTWSRRRSSASRTRSSSRRSRTGASDIHIEPCRATRPHPVPHRRRPARGDEDAEAHPAAARSPATRSWRT